MVLRASLGSNYVAWRSPLWTLLGSEYGTTACIFKLKCLIYRVSCLNLRQLALVCHLKTQ